MTMTETTADRVTRDTELRKLPHYQLHQIASQMNHNKNWQTLMMLIPRDLSAPPQSSVSASSQMRRFKYTQEHMRMIDEASSTGRLPGHILFEEWGTSGRIRPTVAHLLQLLVEASLYRAADYLAVDILHENPPARPVSGPAAPIDIGSLLDDSGEDLNFDSRSVTFNGTSPRRIDSGGSTGQVPVLSELFGSRGLVSVVEENSNAPTLSTNLQSDPVLEGLSDEGIPNLSILMNAAAVGCVSATVTSTAFSSSTTAGGEQMTRSDGLESSDASVYQSNVPNMSLFGGMNFAPAAEESQYQQQSSPSGSTSTPDSSTTTSVSGLSQSSSFANSTTNHSLPQLSFLMNNVQFTSSGDSPASNSTITSSNNNAMATATPTLHPQTTTADAVAKFTFEHLLNCTNNFNDQYFTDPQTAGRKLGAGGFGSVHLAVNLAAQIPVAAVKRLHKNFQQVKEKFDLEIKILSEHSHENLVRLLGYSAAAEEEELEDDGGELCLIYEFVAGGNLERRLELCRRGAAVLPIQKRLGIAFGVAKGIDYLHSAKLIHRDVKSANVLLTEGDIPKLCDFGLLRPLNSRTTTMAVGSSGYMAPEIVRGTYDYEKVDIFAFGVLQLELLTGLAVICAERREDLVTYVEKMVGNEADITALLDVAAGEWGDLGQRWFSGIVIKALELSPNRRSNIAECLDKLQQIVQQ